MTQFNNVKTEWSSEQVGVIIKSLANLRLLADLELVPRYPYFGDKTYPLGRCKEIRDAVFILLQEKLPQSTDPGLVLIRDMLSKGAVLNKVWGSLRDEYFQNAMILGDWYLDVSNDTVNPNKPRVEVLPLTDSQFYHISSFEQFVKIARSYWKVEVYRNDICPALAPFMPLIYLNEDGTSWIGEANDDMLSMVMKSQFCSAESILSCLSTPPEAIVNKWKGALSQLNHNNFIHSQGDPLEFCKEYRVKQYHLDSVFRDRIVMAFLALPRGL
ncbi:hypothetical protein EBI01_16570 [Marinomonas rhizomae]|uniref:Uncharacterized protein n=1 Tax=Marinomonas rhizomae TaxID=491948 RepID=A0A366JHK8_9GAMM|nr:hypothetical protein [Marinomonas rhizomae]RBP85824.1 hypothetical protein DFP80_101319 [Marinomonas rhizomae]RNF70979.1 hypothetical protein EBI01_16570 [Marinomonas rhizomae]